MSEFERFITLTDKLLPLISKVNTDLKDIKTDLNNEIKELESK